MPIYEYACGKCEKVTEALRSMAEADAPLVCEHCGNDKTARLHSVFAPGAASGSTSGATSGGGEMSLPMGGCGRCGDPRGSCGMHG